MRNFVRHRADIPVNIHYEAMEYECMLQNVSLGGMACIGEHELIQHALVTVSFPLLKPEYISEGEVVWCRKITDIYDNELYEIGIEHRGKKDKARLYMVEQISHIEHYRNEVRLSEGRSLNGEEAAREWISIHMDDF